VVKRRDDEAAATALADVCNVLGRDTKSKQNQIEISRDVLFLIVNMSEYSVDDVLVFDAGNDFHRSTAVTTRQYVGKLAGNFYRWFLFNHVPILCIRHAHDVGVILGRISHVRPRTI
jgi:hypothetical protein